MYCFSRNPGRSCPKLVLDESSIRNPFMNFGNLAVHPKNKTKLRFLWLERRLWPKSEIVSNHNFWTCLSSCRMNALKSVNRQIAFKFFGQFGHRYLSFLTVLRFGRPKTKEENQRRRPKERRRSFANTLGHTPVEWIAGLLSVSIQQRSPTPTV